MAVKDQPKTMTPKLRFPEFRDMGEWRQMTLGEITTKADKRNKEANSYPVYSINNKSGFTPQAEQFDGVDSEGRGYDIKQYKIIDRKTFAYNPARINVGSIGYSGDLSDIIISSLYVCFKTKPGVDDHFLQHFFETRGFEVSVRNNVEGGIRSYLFYENFATIAIFLPSINEQRKIAACLTSLDELLAAEGRKLEGLRAHKKGLMQQLFPREGESRPRLRFPEFRDGPEWEANRVGDMEPFVTSGSRGWAAYYADRGSLFVRITNLSRESIFLDLTDSKFVNLPPEAREGVRTQLKTHDVVISVTADIGMIGYVDERVPSPAFINQHIALVRFDTSSVCAKFVAYLLAADESQSRFRASTDNGTKAGMNLTAVQNMPLTLPDVAEQQRIAACLSSLDALIAAASRKLDGLWAHKKGLMQQLFPSPEGMQA